MVNHEARPHIGAKRTEYIINASKNALARMIMTGDLLIDSLLQVNIVEIAAVLICMYLQG